MKPHLEWLFPHNPISKHNIQIVENYLQVQFPEDYVECAKNSHGGHPNLEVYSFTDHPEAVFNVLLSFDPNQSNYIIKIFDSVKDRLPKGIHPFASDPFGNLICFRYIVQNNDDPTIVFWDHELANENPSESVFFVANNFTELLSKLYIP